MGFLLESPVQIVRFSHHHLSTRGGALQILVNGSRPFDNIASAYKLARAIERHNACDTTVIAAADSAATLIYAAGRRRSAMKNASFYFHAPTLGGRPAQTAADQRRLDRIARDMAAFIAKRTGGKLATYLSMMTETGRIVEASEASTLGLINATIKRPHTPRKAEK
jgi:ATP-dependent protease ClpP protease subunit